ncbi:MAG: FAD-binding protein [Nocardia sp.]|nr:FAD-binding protein [Nocardia sp.]
MNRISTHTVVVGAGIAGSWLAYRLAQRGVPVVLLAAEDADTPTVSRSAAAVFNRTLMETTDAQELAALLADETQTQHPELQPLIRDYLPREFGALTELVEFQRIDTMVIPQHPVPFPRLGAGGEILELLHRQIRALGGRLIVGRVTDLLVEENTCRGVAYIRDAGNGVVEARAVVIATGGFSGLMPHAHTPNAGAMLGTFAAAGGHLTNLEFAQRHALGDLTAERVLYPPDLAGARFYRNGERATWLERAHANIDERYRDLQIFQQYWRHNLQVPHSLRRGEENYAIGPIYGLSMGGIAHIGSATDIDGVYVTGEARHDIVADSIIGRPWAIYLCTSGMLADLLESLPHNGYAGDVPAPDDRIAPEATLHATIRGRLTEFADDRFSEPAADAFVSWCRQRRHHLAEAQKSDAALLILAEAYALSARLRRESRGYFYRADHPTADPALAQLRTRASYDGTTDTVSVEMVAQETAGTGTS